MAAYGSVYFSSHGHALASANRKNASVSSGGPTTHASSAASSAGAGGQLKHALDVGTTHQGLTQASAVAHHEGNAAAGAGGVAKPSAAQLVAFVNSTVNASFTTLEAASDGVVLLKVLAACLPGAVSKAQIRQAAATTHSTAMRVFAECACAFGANVKDFDLPNCNKKSVRLANLRWMHGFVKKMVGDTTNLASTRELRPAPREPKPNNRVAIEPIRHEALERLTNSSSPEEKSRAQNGDDDDDEMAGDGQASSPSITTTTTTTTSSSSSSSPSSSPTAQRPDSPTEQWLAESEQVPSPRSSNQTAYHGRQHVHFARPIATSTPSPTQSPRTSIDSVLKTSSMVSLATPSESSTPSAVGSLSVSSASSGEHVLSPETPQSAVPRARVANDRSRRAAKAPTLPSTVEGGVSMAEGRLALVGDVPANELSTCLVSLGLFTQLHDVMNNLKSNRAKGKLRTQWLELFRTHSDRRDSGGILHNDEVLELLLELMPAASKEQLNYCLNMLDLNDDGRMSFSEICSSVRECRYAELHVAHAAGLVDLPSFLMDPSLLASAGESVSPPSGGGGEGMMSPRPPPTENVGRHNAASQPGGLPRQNLAPAEKARAWGVYAVERLRAGTSERPARRRKLLALLATRDGEALVPRASVVEAFRGALAGADRIGQPIRRADECKMVRSLMTTLSFMPRCGCGRGDDGGGGVSVGSLRHAISVWCAPAGSSRQKKRGGKAYWWVVDDDICVDDECADDFFASSHEIGRWDTEAQEGGGGCWSCEEEGVEEERPNERRRSSGDYESKLRHELDVTQSELAKVVMRLDAATQQRDLVLSLVNHPASRAYADMLCEGVSRILLGEEEGVAQTTTAIISRKVAAQRRKKAAVGVGVAAHAR